MFEPGDRVVITGPLHLHPTKGYLAVACKDEKGDREGTCGTMNLRGTVTHVGPLTEMLLVALDKNPGKKEVRIEWQFVRHLDLIERIGELA